MAVKLTTERFATAHFSTDLGACLGFSVENNGAVYCEVAFDKEAANYIPLPPGTAREFPNIGGEKYMGQMIGQFAEANGKTCSVIVVKSTLVCHK